MKLRFVEVLPSPDQFNDMRELVGWGRLDPDLVAKGIANSLYSICAYDGEILVGICRLVGDGYLKIYVEELIVKPEYQKKGVGSEIMKRIMEYAQKNYSKGCSMGLFANTGLEFFYNRFGFTRRKDDKPGMQFYV
jgi:GNAT superfamily N-acetyltransferase